MKSQALIGLSVFVLGIFAAYQLGGKIAGGDMSTVEFAAFGFAALWVGLTILRNWRLGFYMFLVWVLCEDLVRKYLGNNMAIYFGKDVLVGLVFVSLYVEVRKGRVKLFRPPFLLFLYFFLFLGRGRDFQFQLAEHPLRADRVSNSTSITCRSCLWDMR